MINKEFKNETVSMLNKMIANADKGPSGFWVDDYEGCGNPAIFPEFEEGLKKGRLVQKNHQLCPWNTAVMYANGRGNIVTGCYHSCSFSDAKYLSPEMLKAILLRFKKRLESGEYDNDSRIMPLLNANEIAHIEKQKIRVQKEQNRQSEQKRAERKIKAASLLKKYPEGHDFRDLILAYYGEKIFVHEIYFDPKTKDDVQNGEKLTYDEYIDIQIRSVGKQRGSFGQCYFYYRTGEFKGQIERTTDDKVLFKRIYVTGMYDDCSFFDGKEDHVWMNRDGFEEYSVGDSVEFFAEVYRYLKTRNGKLIDFGLRNPENIHSIEEYKLPTDEELFAQEMSQVVCEVCYLSDHCDRINCILALPKKKKRNRSGKKGE